MNDKLDNEQLEKVTGGTDFFDIQLDLNAQKKLIEAFCAALKDKNQTTMNIILDCLIKYGKKEAIAMANKLIKDDDKGKNALIEIIKNY